MVTVFFRYDDYSSMSSECVDRGLIDIFSRLQATCTFAVVPAITSVYPAVQGAGVEISLSKEKVFELKYAVECGAVDVALHGWNHATNVHCSAPFPSEFRGLSVDAQTAILLRGRMYLEDQIGVAPVVFVPPWNSYDDATLTALSQSGFLGISANRYSPVSRAEDGLKYAPMTVELPELRKAVSTARESGEVAPIIGVMLHPYDFRESGDSRAVLSLLEFEQDLSWLCKQDDVQILPLSVLVASGAQLDAVRFSSNMPSSFERVFPSFISKTSTHPIYSTAIYAKRRRQSKNLQLLIFLFALMGLGACLGWVAGVFLGGGQNSFSALVIVILLCSVVAVAVRAIVRRVIYATALQLIAFVLGVSLGLALP